MTSRATTDYPVQDVIAARWSPYAFADRPVKKEDLLSLFEAARWAASSYNEQPWSYLSPSRTTRRNSRSFSPAWSRGTRRGPRPPRSWPSAAPA